MASAGRKRPNDAPSAAGGRWDERLEWFAAAAAAAVVIVVVWLLLREAQAVSPADLRVALSAAEVRDGRAEFRFALANRGGRPAAAVGVALEMRDGDVVVERRRLTVDFVPARSEAFGAFYVDAPRRGLVPVAVVEGYVDP